MKRDEHDTPPCVYILADHLDAALAAGEDLVAAAANWPTGDFTDPTIPGAQRWVLGRIRTHEMSLLSRILHARQSALELAAQETSFKPLAHLFVSSLNELEDAASNTLSLTDCGFETGDDVISYLRSRGLIEPDQPASPPNEPLSVGEKFLVAGKVPLAISLDLTAELIDALDLQFDLYPDTESSENSAAFALPPDTEDAAVLGSAPTDRSITSGTEQTTALPVSI